MDPIDSPRSFSAREGADPTQRELQSLRLTLQITLAALLILAGSIAILIFRQVSLLRRQTDATARQAQHLVQIFNITIGPQAQAFENRLQSFAETNAEFKSRLARFYGPTSATNTAQAAASPATGTVSQLPTPPRP